jgi:predicted nucleic acid-binding protein
MKADRLFLDTSYVLGLLNRRDRFHAAARKQIERVETASLIITTQAVLIEIGNALSALNRSGAEAFIRDCYATPQTVIAGVDTSLLLRGLELYGSRDDKEWGLTDCISFVVMNEHEIVDAHTADVHFRQAGFRALLLEE